MFCICIQGKLSQGLKKKIKNEDVVKVIKFKMIMKNYLLYISLLGVWKNKFITFFTPKGIKLLLMENKSGLNHTIFFNLKLTRQINVNNFNKTNFHCHLIPIFHRFYHAIVMTLYHVTWLAVRFMYLILDSYHLVHCW